MAEATHGAEMCIVCFKCEAKLISYPINILVTDPVGPIVNGVLLIARTITYVPWELKTFW